MGTIRIRSKALSDNPELKAPVFNFSEYVADGEHTYKNDEEQIDFVTANDSLYVCLSHDGVTPTYEDIDDNADFLKLVSQGPQGIRGPRGYDGVSAETPRLNAEFDNDQLRVYINGELETVSPRLTGKSWRPKLEDNMIVWELSNKMYAPDPIDLEELRPVQEKPLLLRVDSDNTKRTDEKSGPARFIQWKYEGEGPWTNLISISELMNLALAGITIFPVEDAETGKTEYHLGHKEVLEATYASDKDGHRIISNVELGHVLFDAGPIPVGESSGDDNDFQGQIDLILADLARLDTEVVKSVTINGTKKTPNPSGNVSFDIPTGTGDLSGYATENWVQNNYQPKGNYVTSVNNVSPQPGSNGAITIDVGNLGSFDIRLKNDGKTLEKTVNGTTWTDIVDLSQFEGSGSGCDKCWSQEEIVQLIENVLSGRIPTNIVVPSDLDAYVKWTDISGTYATMSWVSDEIARALSGGQYEPEYHRVFTLYQRTGDRLTPPNPPLANVWEWNLTEGDILTDASHKSGWDNHPQNATSGTPYLWMASATFSSITHKEVKPSNADSAWTLVCLTGEAGLSGANGFNGTDGADGNGVEFIFTLIRDINDKTRVDTPVAPSSSQPDSYPAGWEDHPQGIGYYIPNQITTTLENLGNNEILFGIELASMRTGTNGEWGPYCAPFIWSMWGEDGIDGDGVEYIFLVADETSVEIDDKKVSLPELLWKIEGSSPNFIPTTNLQVEHLGPSYQVPDWVGTRNNGWTDNPSDVDSEQPFEFVSVRKYHDGTGWGPFCEPRLWSHFGGITVNPVTTITTSAETNYIPYKEWAFYRANSADGTIHTDLSTYDVVYDFSTFGTQSNPDPVYSDLTPEQKLAFYRNPELYTKTVKNSQVLDITWQDTVPPGDGQLWVITAHIADESQSTDQGWTTPSRWGDKAGFNVEYSASEEASTVYANPSLWNNHNLTFNDFQGSDEQREGDWRTAVEDAGYGIWNDVVEEPKYMATTVLGDDGIWSKWTITKIVGEDGPRGPQGEQGQDGNGVEFVFFALTPEQYKNRSNFIGQDNKFYVYDNVEHDEKTWQQNEYLPYAVISNVPEGRLWATDNNPGLTEEKPYIFVSTRHQVNGRWSQFHNIPGTGLMTSFGPASLWLAGDEIDYEYASVNVSDDTIQVYIDPETKYPTSTVFTSDTMSLDFYHGSEPLSIDKIELLVNNQWETLATVTGLPNNSGYSFTPSTVTTPYGTVTCYGSINEYAQPKAFELKFRPTQQTQFNTPVTLHLKFYSTNGFINSNGVLTHYVADLSLLLNPIELERVWTLQNQQESIIKKENEDSTLYSPWPTYWSFGYSGSMSFDTTLGTLECIPGDYMKWKLNVIFDDTTYYSNALVGKIFHDWVVNEWNDGEESACNKYYRLNGTECSRAEYPIVLNCYKKFESDGHYLGKTKYTVDFNGNQYQTPIKDKVTLQLYYNSTLIDEQTVPIIYNGKNGTTFEIDDTPVASAVVSNNGIVFNSASAPIAELDITNLNDFENSIDANLLTDLSVMTQADSSENYIGLKDVKSLSQHSSDLIRVVNTDGNVDISLNYALLVARLKETLFGGNEPVVQTITISNNGGDANMNNNGGILVNQPLTIESSNISSVVSDGNDVFTINQGNNSATVANVTNGFTVNTSTGASHFDVGANVNNAPKAPEEIVSAARVIVGYENIYPTDNLEDDPGQVTVFMRLAGNHSGATVTNTLHLSKPLKVITIDSNDADSLQGEYNTDIYRTFFEEAHSVIPISNGIVPELVLSFEGIKNNTLISAYMTSTIYDGEDVTEYRSATVYFRTTTASLII